MRTVTLEDLYQFQWPNNPQFSPDGKQVVYEITKARKSENDNETHLWIAETSGESKRAITTEGTRNLGAVWSPDGKEIAYISNRSCGMQVWIYSFESGESRMLSHFHYNVSGLAYAPDGKTIYALLPVNDEVKEWDDEKSASELSKNPSDRTYDTLYYKFDGVGFGRGTRKQIIAIDVETKAYKVVTDGSLNVEEFSISPDGKSITFSTIDFENENPLFNGGLYHISTDGGQATKLYDEIKIASPAYSPDGKWLAFIGGDVHQNLYVLPVLGGEAICLSEGYPGTLSDMIYTDSRNYKMPLTPQWSEDSKHIYVLSGYQGTNEIVRFSVGQDEAPVTVVGGGRTILHFDYNGKDSIVTAYTAPSTPGRVSLMDISANNYIVRNSREYTEELVENLTFFPEQEVYLDDCNSEIMSEIIVVEPETFSYESADGWKIHGFMIKPANVDAGKKYPVVLDIHGGPHSTHGFTYFHQMQLYSAAGYGVVYLNPRGSSGYGEKFTKAVIGEYGTKDMQDILNGMDAAIASYDFLDETRVAVTGLSYGGYMTNWIVTHTDRFHVAISEGGICNWVSMYGTSDIAPGFIDREFANQTSFEELWKASPLAYVENVNTPILIVHAEDDLRVPMEQAEQFYSYIKRQNKETRLVRIPECSHVMLQNGAPDKKIARLEAMIDWLQTYLPTK